MKSRLLVAAAVGLLGPLVGSGAARANTSPVPGLPFSSCLPEQFPPGGATRQAGAVPYQIPFTATLGTSAGGGFLMISSASSLFDVTLGGPVNLVNSTGSITASGCGTLVLPNETGSLAGNPYGNAGNNFADAYNNNFRFANGTSGIPTSISLRGFPGVSALGVPLLAGFASADGKLGAAIDLTPAANGGQNVEFFSSAKATSILTLGALQGLENYITLPSAVLSELNQLLGKLPTVPVPGGECTVPIGDLIAAGMPRADIENGVTGLTAPSGPLATSYNFAPVHLSSQASAGRPAGFTKRLDGQPITGAITGAQAVLVSNSFPVAKIDPNTPPSPDAPDATAAPASLCTPSNASLFDQLLGLPSPAGSNIFYAPGTFAIHTSA